MKESNHHGFRRGPGFGSGCPPLGATFHHHCGSGFYTDWYSQVPTGGQPASCQIHAARSTQILDHQRNLDKEIVMRVWLIDKAAKALGLLIHIGGMPYGSRRQSARDLAWKIGHKGCSFSEPQLQHLQYEACIDAPPPTPNWRVR